MKCIDINSRQQQRAPIRAAGEDRAGGAGLATWHLSAEWGPNTLALCVNKFEQANKNKAMHTNYKHFNYNYAYKVTIHFVVSPVKAPSSMLKGCANWITRHDDM